MGYRVLVLDPKRRPARRAGGRRAPACAARRPGGRSSSSPDAPTWSPWSGRTPTPRRCASSIAWCPVRPGRARAGGRPAPRAGEGRRPPPGAPHAPTTAPVSTLAELLAAVAQVGTPVGAQDRARRLRRQGPAAAPAPADAEPAFARARGGDGTELILERWVDFRLEASVICARAAPAGAVVAFPMVENQHRNGILDFTIAPARVSPAGCSARRGEIGEALVRGAGRGGPPRGRSSSSTARSGVLRQRDRPTPPQLRPLHLGGLLRLPVRAAAPRRLRPPARPPPSSSAPPPWPTSSATRSGTGQRPPRRRRRPGRPRPSPCTSTGSARRGRAGRWATSPRSPTTPDEALASAPARQGAPRPRLLPPLRLWTAEADTFQQGTSSHGNTVPARGGIVG